MRYWQPIHHARWRSFLTGLDAVLGAQGAVVKLPDLEQKPSAQKNEALAEAITPEKLTTSEVSAEAAAGATPASDRNSPESDIPESLPASQPVENSEAWSDPASQSPSLSAAPTVLGNNTPTIPSPQRALFPASLNPAFGFSTARAFFSALRWNGGLASQAPTPELSPKKGRPLENGATKQSKPVQQNPTDVSRAATLISNAASFFRHIPWLGSSHYGEITASIHVTAARECSGLDPRTAELPGDNPLITGMLSAARTSDRLAAKPSRPNHAQGFFSSLPWAHT